MLKWSSSLPHCPPVNLYVPFTHKQTTLRPMESAKKRLCIAECQIDFSPNPEVSAGGGEEDLVNRLFLTRWSRFCNRPKLFLIGLGHRLSSLPVLSQSGPVCSSFRCVFPETRHTTLHLSNVYSMEWGGGEELVGLITNTIDASTTVQAGLSFALWTVSMWSIQLSELDRHDSSLHVSLLFGWKP